MTNTYGYKWLCVVVKVLNFSSHDLMEIVMMIVVAATFRPAKLISYLARSKFEMQVTLTRTEQPVHC